MNGKPNPGKELHELIKTYLHNVHHPTKNKVDELEIRFGIFTPPTNDFYRKSDLSKRAITKVDFDNVVKYALSTGFKIEHLGEQPEQYYLRITEASSMKQSDAREQLKLSNIRLEIKGEDLIQQYCRINDVQPLLNEYGERAQKLIKFTQKTNPPTTNQTTNVISFYDYNYRVSYKWEEDFPLYSAKSKESLEQWKNNKKTFRYIKRYRLVHPTLPLSIDLSTIKTNKKDKSGKVMIPTYTLQEAKVFDNPETYEIEIEVNNGEVKGLTLEQVLQAMRQGIHILLSGLQTSNYPISYAEQDRVLREYLDLIYREKPEPYAGKSIRPSDFFGPSSETLQIQHLQIGQNQNNVLSDYAVTDKADGERKMLFICPDKGKNAGNIYLIDTAMNVVFTGKQCASTNKELYYTLFDGEHILYNKEGKFINQYMAFDIYFTYQKKTEKENDSGIFAVRNYPFIDNGTTKETAVKKSFRYNIMKKRVRELNESIIKNESDSCFFVVDSKDFYVVQDGQSIFDCCHSVLDKNETQLRMLVCRK